MNKQQEEILQYYSNLINEIDVKCEKAILFFKTEDAVNEIETNRQKIISKIKQIEMIKLENVKDSETLYDGSFAFFISNDRGYRLFCDYHDSKYASKEKLDLKKKAFNSRTMSQKRGEKFEFVKHLGQLVVASSLRQDNVKKLMNGEFNDFIYHGHLFDICGDDFSGDTTKMQVFAQLIKRKKDQVIIDLCQKENNQIHRLKLSGSMDNPYGYIVCISESDFEMIPTYLDVESVRELRLVDYNDIEFPTQLLKPFKNLTRLELGLYDVKSYNENTFIGLESLEILQFFNFEIMEYASQGMLPEEYGLEQNTFKRLINLKKVMFSDCYYLMEN